MKVKVFTDSDRYIEERVNNWLKKHPDIYIHHIKQSQSQSRRSLEEGGLDPDVVVSIWYAN